MAVPQAVTAVVSTGAHKPILRIMGASAAALVGAFLVSVPLLLSLLLSVLTPPLNAASSLSGRPLVVGDWGGPEAGYSVTAGFGRVDRSDCSICSSFHRGVDLSAGCRSPIFAAGPGTVLSAGWDTTGYGNQVTIDHGGGLTSIYGHMPDGGVMVAVGAVVKAGDQLGVEGSSGRSTGCHVHFEIRLDGQSIDPITFMRARGITL